jgi:acetyltransferase-like isoleucine patch superfamily enzyme
MLFKIIRKIKWGFYCFITQLFIFPVKIKYKLLSSNPILGSFKASSPVLSLGLGKIFANGSNLGVWRSPYYFNSYIYLDARSKDSRICIGKNVWINNNAFICADKTSITIKDDCLIGTNFSCIDSDFHCLKPDKRSCPDYECNPVILERNIFIGNNVSILKGVTIGENSVVANGAIVTKSFPANVIIGGNPAKIIREL